MKYANSADNLKIAYEASTEKETVLLFVHGWLGNKRWWDKQRDFLKEHYQVVQMDLVGHGDSEKKRSDFSAELYASDIVAVAKNFPNQKIILVGHSMSGIYATMASLQIPNTIGIILADTLKNLDFSFGKEQIDQMMEMYRHNFEFSVKNIIPQYLFAPKTPEDVKNSLQTELINQSDFAAEAIKAFYITDVRPFASLVKVPVRAINAEMPPTEKAVNLKYFKNFDFSSIKDVGHYPMLETPQDFNEKLTWAINEITKE